VHTLGRSRRTWIIGWLDARALLKKQENVAVRLPAREVLISFLNNKINKKNFFAEVLGGIGKYCKVFPNMIKGLIR